MKFISMPEKHWVESEDGSFVVFSPNPLRGRATRFVVRYKEKQFVFATADQAADRDIKTAPDGSYIWCIKLAGQMIRGYDKETRELCRYDSFKKFASLEEQNFFIENFKSAMAIFQYFDGDPVEKRGTSYLEFSDELTQAFESGAFIK